jgi:HNH endonuclease
VAKTYVPADLRRLVARRADFLCEYCLIHEDDTFFGCEVDHILSEKHGGKTEEANLAYACLFCNRAKGSDIASSAQDSGALVRFFNPRVDSWAAHFNLDVEGVIITPRSQVGEVTARILGFNRAERLLERSALKIVGRYPTAEALKLIRGD